MKRIIVICLVLFSGLLHAQKTFYKTYGHVTEGSEGRTINEAADGGYFLTSYIFLNSEATGVVTKLNCSGEIEWENFFDGGSPTLPLQLLPQDDNGCLVSFSSRDVNAEWHIIILRLDAAGNTTWTQNLDMQAAQTTGGMVTDASNNIYVCGLITLPAGITGTAVAKLSSAGNIMWHQHYFSGISHTPTGIAVSPSGIITVCGYGGIALQPFTDVFIFSCNATDGTFIKRKIVSSTYDDEPRSVCADADGNFYIAGFSYFLNTEWDIMLLKLDEDLNLLQSKFYDGNGAQGENARYIIAGNNNELILFGDGGGFNDKNPMLLNVNTDGNINYTKRYLLSPSYTNYFYYGSQCRDGGFMMTGDVRPVTQFRIAPVLRTDATGDAGCFSATYNLAERSEQMMTFDAPLQSAVITPVQDTTQLPYSANLFTTDIFNVCSATIPCGNFTEKTDSLCPVKCFRFTETSIGASSWEWQFPGGTPSSFSGKIPPLVCYNTQGIYEVTLTLGNATGTISVTHSIDASTSCEIFIPNIFTPQGDQYNEIFQGVGINEPFSLQIFNRWGNEVFSSAPPGKWWDGNFSKDHPAPAGVYLYLLHLKNSNKLMKGTVQLVR